MVLRGGRLIAAIWNQIDAARLTARGSDASNVQACETK